MMFEVAEAHRAHPLERVCGDACLVSQDDWGVKCVILDGVGHGPKAHRVASQLLGFMREHVVRDPSKCLQALHCEAAGSEGAVAGVMFIERASGTLSYAALGNTVARVFGRHRRQFISQPGVLGQRMRSLLPQTAQVAPGDVVVLHTDGISGNFDAVTLPELRVASAQSLVATLIEHFSKPYDDAGCIVVKVLP